MTYRKLFFSLLAVALLAVATGCDSGGEDDDVSDAELFVGTWEATELMDGSGERALEVSPFTVSFTADTYGLNVVFDNPQQPPIQFNGADYEVDEGDDVVSLIIPAAVTGGAGNIGLDFSYVFSNDNEELALTVNNETQVTFLNVLFQPETLYTAPVTLTLSR